MKVFFINPPFKSVYGKFSRESRSPSITKSGALYYPLWLIYAAALTEKDGFDVEFLDAPSVPLNERQSLDVIASVGEDTRLFVLDTSTPSIYSDAKFAAEIKKHIQIHLLSLLVPIRLRYPRKHYLSIMLLMPWHVGNLMESYLT